MKKDLNKSHDEKNHDNENQKVHFTNDNKDLKESGNTHPDGRLPEDDPALINPDELATFPEEQKNPHLDVEDENESRLVNRKTSPVRDGRNITRTDTTPDNDGGFM